MFDRKSSLVTLVAQSPLLCAEQITLQTHPYAERISYDQAPNKTPANTLPTTWPATIF